MLLRLCTTVEIRVIGCIESKIFRPYRESSSRHQVFVFFAEFIFAF